MDRPPITSRKGTGRRIAAAAAAHLTLATFFSFLFHEQYWRWRDCIEQAESSCVTPDGANLTEGGVFWAGPGVLFAMLFVRAVFRFAAASRGSKR